MTLSKLHPICLLLFISILFSCKKDNAPAKSQTAPADEIVLSINGGADVHYNGSTYNPETERNYASLIDFARTYYTTATRLPQQYNIAEFTLNDSNILGQTFPYQVKKAQMFISIFVPGNLGTFAYDNSQNTEKGNVAIIITSAKNQRLQGTFSGIIYSTYNQSPQPQSINIKGSFDVNLPAFSNL